MAGISILIPTRDRAHFLESAIQSVIAQAQRPLEILISDNCSSDDTRSVIQRYMAKPIDGVTVRGFYQERDIGPVANHIFLFEQAVYQYCCFLNDDDFFLDPSFLSDSLRILQVTEDCFLCVGNAIERSVNSVGGEMHESVMVNLPKCKEKDWQVLDGTEFAFALGGSVGFPSYSCIVFDGEEARGAGAFKPPYVIAERESKTYGFAQEEGLCYLYLLAVGHRVAYKSEPVAVRLCHPNQACRQKLSLDTSYASIMLLWSSLCTGLIRDRRASPVRIKLWFLAMLPRCITMRCDWRVFRTLYGLRPGITLLYIVLQVLRRGYIRLRNMVRALRAFNRSLVRRLLGPGL